MPISPKKDQLYGNHYKPYNSRFQSLLSVVTLVEMSPSIVINLARAECSSLA